MEVVADVHAFGGALGLEVLVVSSSLYYNFLPASASLKARYGLHGWMMRRKRLRLVEAADPCQLPVCLLLAVPRGSKHLVVKDLGSKTIYIYI